MHAPRFFPPPERSVVLYIPSVFGVMSPLVLRVPAKTQTVLAKTQTIVPIHGKLFPIFKRFFGRGLIRSYIILQFHLFKFAQTENKIARSNFVSKCLADLADSERKLRMH